jgi:3-phenylpropionate/cinnamic acid dioxygenase small subunit
VREVTEQVAVAITRLYARQSRLIDGGEAAGWAATFTADGEFHSPSYPEPAVGTAALTAFAERFAAAGRDSGVVSRHVVTNVDVLPGETDDEVTAHAYLQIIATPRGEDSRLVRLTTVTDRLVREGGSWRVARRDMRRDDA